MAVRAFIVPGLASLAGPASACRGLAVALSESHGSWSGIPRQVGGWPRPMACRGRGFNRSEKADPTAYGVQTRKQRGRPERRPLCPSVGAAGALSQVFPPLIKLQTTVQQCDARGSGWWEGARSR